MTLEEKIQHLKQEQDAAILAHYYVNPEVQAIADFTGDSYFLSKKAVELPHQTIVFCGVAFMGESAKLLNPGKRVLLPDPEADCPMAHMATEETVRQARARYDDLAVVCYINSTARIKSWSDVCVTSANAVHIVKKLPNKNILFLPDRNLAHFVAKQVPEKHFVYNEGFCPVHEHMRPEEIQALQAAHPDAPVLAHPECNRHVLALADYIGSTSQIIAFARDSHSREFIIATESGVRHALTQARPEASFYFPRTEPLCRDMKKITLEKVAAALEQGTGEVKPEDGQIHIAAQKTLARMLE